jgi:hypothetical protein
MKKKKEQEGESENRAVKSRKDVAAGRVSIIGK